MERVEIKQNQFYVTCIDKFMSGWGRANGLNNKLIFLCDSEKEAKIVRDNAENRSDMHNVEIHSTPPTDFRHTKGYEYETNGKFVQIKTKKDMPKWFEPGAF